MIRPELQCLLKSLRRQAQREVDPPPEVLLLQADLSSPSNAKCYRRLRRV